MQPRILLEDFLTEATNDAFLAPGMSFSFDAARVGPDRTSYTPGELCVEICRRVDLPGRDDDYPSQWHGNAVLPGLRRGPILDLQRQYLQQLRRSWYSRNPSLSTHCAGESFRDSQSPRPPCLSVLMLSINLCVMRSEDRKLPTSRSAAQLSSRTGSLRCVFGMGALSEQPRDPIQKQLCGDDAERAQHKNTPRRAHGVSPLIHFF